MTGMTRFTCSICGYVYDPKKGDPEAQVDPGTSLERVPDEWLCPLCQADKSTFEPVKEDPAGAKGAVRRYERPELTVIWKSHLCNHNGNCIRRLPEVFDLNRRPWVDVDGAEADEIRRVVDECPTGALSYRDREAGR